MNAPFKQTERLGRLTTDLGKDAMVLLRFTGTEYLNDLFEFHVEALAATDDLDFAKLIGTHATVELESREVMKPLDGIITSISWAGVGESGHVYNLTLRPWFWLAGKRRNYRIFHRKCVDQILRELLSDYDVFSNPHLEIKLGSPYEEIEYTVQNGESDLNFARRQMERHGISFHFRFEKGSHTLVLTDDELAHEVVGEIPFKRYDGHHQNETEHFWEWSPERNFTTGAVFQTDYNFKFPYQKMETWQASDAEYAFGHVESYDYPGDYTSETPGKIVTRMRQRQERGADRRNRAVGDCVSLSAGLRVKLGGDKVPGHGETYLCLAATHNFVSEAYGSGGQESDGYSYSGSFVLMPDTAPMVPPKRTPLTRVYGPQTAVVVGDGEIDVDEYGRILVQFHWDLKKSYSMRCRVSQSWAGRRWGGIVLPRIGMEVVVEFLEGDPDKPLVTGAVYNAKNMPPYDLPEHKTRSTFKTETHQGTGFNELRFEDKKDEEEIRMIAEKDLNVLVRNNAAKLVFNDSSEAVLDNKLVEVFGNNIASVAGSMTIYTGPSGPAGLRTQAMGSQKNILSRMAYSLDRHHLKENGAPGDYTIISNGSHDITVGRSAQHHIGENFDVTVGQNYSTRIQGNRSARINGDSSENVIKTKIDFVGDRYVLVCGKSRLEMLSSGEVKIFGTDISINGVSIKISGKRVDIN